MKIAKKNIGTVSLIINLILAISCFLLSILFVWDIFTTPFEVDFPWEPGGVFYSSLEIYLLSGVIKAIINMLPIVFLTFKNLRHKSNFISILVVIFDVVYFFLVSEYYR